MPQSISSDSHCTAKSQPCASTCGLTLTLSRLAGERHDPPTSATVWRKQREVNHLRRSIGRGSACRSWTCTTASTATNTVTLGPKPFARAAYVVIDYWSEYPRPSAHVVHRGAAHRACRLRARARTPIPRDDLRIEIPSFYAEATPAAVFDPNSLWVSPKLPCHQSNSHQVVGAEVYEQPCGGIFRVATG